MSSGRERLAELRAARGSTSPRTTHFEMQHVPSPDPPGNGVSTFYDEIGSLRDSLATLDQSISRVADLHSQSIASTDLSATRVSAAELDQQTSHTRSIISDIKTRLQSISQNYKLSNPTNKSKRDQVDTIKNQFKECIVRYQKVEKDSQSRYRQRMERQFRIVKPDATDAEVQELLSGERTDQVFAQALMDSNRYGESRAAYREVQTRHEEIRNVERTLEELAQLFNDLALFVEKDEDNLNQLNNLAEGVEDDTRQGYDQTEKAVKSARAARKKKIWCFWISVVIVLGVVGIVLGVTLGRK